MHTASTLFELELFKHRELLLGKELWEILDALHGYLLQQPFSIRAKIDSQATLVNPECISIGEGSIVEAGAYIKGPAVLGCFCEVRHGAYVRGDLLAGDRCVIGHATEVKNSLLLNDAKAGHFAYVGDSILGHRVNLGAGTKCANLRFDEAAVKVQGIDTRRRKVGAFFGDGAQTGCNSVTEPGMVLGRGEYLMAAKMRRSRRSACSV